jgi:DNA-binding transcriptional ArsR family regulator
MHKDVLLEEYYKENYEKILDVHNQSSYEAIRDNMRGLTEVGFLEKTRETLYVSYCLLNKFSIWFIPIADGMVGIMGVDYLKAIGFIKTLREDVNLRDFSNALSDENRIKIVDMLLEREEIICKDLERIFDFSGSTAYHHITILTKAGVLKTRNDKKTILYSLNRKYFDNVIQALRKYSSYRKG